MPTVLEGIGVEELLDVVEVKLREKINNAIDRQQERWADMDEARADMRGVNHVPIELEHVEPSNFYTFHIPSLVEDDLPLDHFPYIAVVPDDNVADPEDASMDQIDVRQNSISIHAIAKATAEEGAEVAGRRAARMAEAIWSVVSTDPVLKAMLRGISNPMRARMSEPFSFNIEGLEDQNYWWVAAGTQYSVKNLSKPPEGV